MTTNATELDLKSLENKAVILQVRNSDGELVTLEGVVSAASEVGVAFKPKGKSGLDLIESDRIESAEALPEKPKVIKAKKLAPVTLDNVRQHLADKHSLNLEWLNSVSNEEAKNWHDGIDHKAEGSTLGHYHEAVDDKADENDALANALSD